MMNYQETLLYLYQQLPMYQRVGAAAYKADLETSLALDRSFNYPHKAYPVIHVAGTNGKGSVSHMIASVLQEAGYRTGLYTSPHLEDFRERVRVNGMPVGKDEVVAFVHDHHKLFTSLKPSFFEMTVALAFDYFRRREVDVAVVETGMGGRLDSTNIVTPALSVITNIGLDHTRFLGTGRRSIAREKAGIIKKMVPVVLGEEDEEISDVFVSRAASLGSPMYSANRNFSSSFLEYRNGLNHYSILAKENGRRFEVATDLLGSYQQRNLVTTIQTLNLAGKTYKIPASSIREGLAAVQKNTGLKGRWQILGREPLQIADTAHNREGLEQVMSQLLSIPCRKLYCVLGLVEDKNLSLLLKALPQQAKYAFTRARLPRALDEQKLQKEAWRHGLKGNAFPGVAEAVQYVRSAAGSEDVIFIGGSTFVVAEALQVN